MNEETPNNRVQSDAAPRRGALVEPGVALFTVDLFGCNDAELVDARHVFQRTEAKQVRTGQYGDAGVDILVLYDSSPANAAEPDDVAPPSQWAGTGN